MHIRQLTQADFDKFVGGQLDAYNPDEGYHYRGEIHQIHLGGIKKPLLHINFSWVAQSKAGWYRVPCFVYAASLDQYLLAEADSVHLVLHSLVNGETATFYTADGDKLDLTEVKEPEFSGASR